MNIYSVHITPPDMTVSVRSGTVEAAVRNALYWHGAGWRSAKSAGISVACDGPATVVRPLLWVPREIVRPELLDLDEITIERLVWDDDETVDIRAGGVYELHNNRRRSGIVVRALADANYVRRTRGADTLHTPADEYVIQQLRVSVVPEETLWPAKGEN